MIISNIALIKNYPYWMLSAAVVKVKMVFYIVMPVYKPKGIWTMILCKKAIKGTNI